MKKIIINNGYFLHDFIQEDSFKDDKLDGYYNECRAEVLFSTAEGNLNFSKETLEGLNNLKNLKENLGLCDLGFLNQIHSDKIFIYDKSESIKDGDSLITNNENVAVGVFTADCVPVLMYDPVSKAIAAVHSGYKGTLDCIVKKTIDILVEEYYVDTKNLIVYVGPHIEECCYEVSEEVINDFYENDLYKGNVIANRRNLSLKTCIKIQLAKSSILEKNIKFANVCTSCNKDIKMYSYRKNKESRRMFSLIYWKQISKNRD